MNAPDPKANTTTEAYLAYKAGYLEESELKPKLYEPYLHFDAWLAYWAGLVPMYPIKAPGKNLFNKNGIIIGSNWTGAIQSKCYPFNLSQPTRAVYLLPVKPNTKYTVSLASSNWYVMEIIDVDSNFTIISKSKTTQENDFTATITTGEHFAFLGFKFKYGSAGTTTITKEMLSELKLQVELGDTATSYEDYTGDPEMLTDEEALVAYLAGVTDTYPEEIKDPYDVRIVGYLRHLASIRWTEPDYPVNNEEFYLSTMEPTHTSNSEPSADIELDTTDGNIISVEAYGDTKQQTYSGKNLSPYAIYDAEDGRILNMPDLILAAGTYTISFDLDSFELGTNSTMSIYMSLFNSSGTNVTGDKNLLTIASDTSLSRYNYTFEASEDVHYTTSQIRITTSTYNNGGRCKISNIQIESGSSPSSYEPYVGGIPAPNPDYPQDVNVVTGEQTITVTGKNQANPSAPVVYRNNNQITATPLETGIMISHPDNGTNKQIGFLTQINLTSYVGKTIRMKASFEAEHSGEYRLYRMNENGGDRVSMAVTTSSGTEISFVVPEDLGSSPYLAFVLMLVNNVALSVSFTDLIITIDNDDMSFIPYQTPQSYTINLGSTELCKIGDYQDYIYKSGDDWYLHKETGSVTYDGSEDWTISLATSRVTTPKPNSNWVSWGSSVSTYVNKGLSNYLKGGDTGNSSADNVFNVGSANVFIKATSVGTSTDVNTWKTWLGSHNLTCYSILENSTDTKITDSTLVGQLDALAGADTYDEKTYIRVTADGSNLPALLKVEAYKY